MSQPTQPPPPAATALSVSDVLMQARTQSETDDPFEVDAGKVTLAQTNDEESDPLSVD
jgi:hypothetical protein